MQKLLCLAAAVFVVAAPAHAEPIRSTGYTRSAGDPVWSVLWRAIDSSATGFGSAANAPLITSILAPPWQPNVSGVNTWLGANNVGSIDPRFDGAHRYEYAFTTKVTLAAAQTVTGAIGFDNYFIGAFIGGSFDTATGTYTRGTQFITPTSLLGAGKENKSGFCRDGDGLLPSSAFPGCTVDFAFDLPAGTYDITFVMQGDGFTDGFLLKYQGVILVPEPATLGLLAVAVGALAWTQRRRITRA